MEDQIKDCTCFFFLWSVSHVLVVSSDFLIPLEGREIKFSNPSLNSVSFLAQCSYNFVSSNLGVCIKLLPISIITAYYDTIFAVYTYNI